MKYFLIALAFLIGPALFAESIDHNASSFSQRERPRERVDTYDFSGIFPNLENIDIDAKRKKRVEFDLSGEYPLLTSVNYEGSFGHLNGKLTGQYPALTLVNLFCTNCAMQLDLSGAWQRSCEINIIGQKEDVMLTLPEGVGLIIHTKTAPSGKVVAKEGLKKQGVFHIWKKTYQNDLAETADIVLTLYVETTAGKIFLN